MGIALFTHHVRIQTESSLSFQFPTLVFEFTTAQSHLLDHRYPMTDPVVSTIHLIEIESNRERKN